MPTKRTVSQKKNQQKQQMNNIQMIALGVIILGVVVIFLALVVVPNLKPPIPGIPASALTNPPTDSASNLPADTPQAQSTPAYKQYAAPPPMTIDTTKQYFANFTMANGGQFVVQLYPDKAPITVNSFVFLANDGYFNGVTFHRVLDGFMAQGGDPSGTGMGGPGYQFKNESNDLKFDKAGVVAMANAGRDTNGSQFFITFGPQDQLDGDYTIFGQVISGMDVVNAITRRDPEQNPNFTGDAIKTVTITTK